MYRPRSPTLEVQAVFAVVFIVEQVGGVVGVGPSWFALSDPMARPWTLVTSVYAHASLRHLLANAVALALIGAVVERSTTRLRFHAFVLVTGAAAGLTEVLVGGLVGGPTAVIGASGAVLALIGYAVSANPIAVLIFDRFDVARRTQLIGFVGLAVIVTIVTAASGVALVAHFTGFLIGLLAGRIGVLSVR